MKWYTGVGSRETPPDVLEQFTKLGKWLWRNGYILRSGGADGADAAFEAGGGPADIYLPWRGFNGSTSPLCTPSPEAFEMAAAVHPAWSSLKQGAQKLHARNCHQVLGDSLDKPSEFVVCWTSDGCTTEAERTRSTGGTATAIVVACRHGIPVFNVRRPESRLALRAHLLRVCQPV